MKIVPVKFEDVAVGDTVYVAWVWENDSYDALPRTVLAKHQGINDSRQYVVAAYLGDQPISYTPSQLGKEHTPIIETIVVHGSAAYEKPAFSWRIESDTHKITYNIVDGEVDCSSVKMGKL